VEVDGVNEGVSETYIYGNKFYTFIYIYIYNSMYLYIHIYIYTYRGKRGGWSWGRERGGGGVNVLKVSAGVKGQKFVVAHSYLCKPVINV
jgi:hypothetical protein